MIYLDNNASSAPLPVVIEAMAEAMRRHGANPSSVHPAGQRARHAIDTAREQVARLIGARWADVLFTSGGTESVNLALHGVMAAVPLSSRRRRVLITAVEHSCVTRAAERLAATGFGVHVIGVDGDGRVDVAAFRAALSDETALVSVIHANNETGVTIDIGPLATLAVERGALVHVDAVQSVGKVPLCVDEWPVDLLSISAHKFHGPAGVGALFVRKGARLAPLIAGGGQERGRRGGTENLPGIVGMGVAALAAADALAETAAHTVALRDRLERMIRAALPQVVVAGAAAPRVGNTSNLVIPGVPGELLLMRLAQEGFCVSSGAACDSGSLEPSHVLLAMGFSEADASASVRVSTSRFTTESEMDAFAAALCRHAKELAGCTA